MSAKVMGLVFEADLPRAEKFILLALADHSKEDGSDVYPSIPRISWKTGYSERQVQSILGSLEGLGVLRKVHEGGRGPGDVHKYKILLHGLRPLAAFNHHKAEETAPLDGELRVKFSPNKGEISRKKGCNLQQKKGAKIAVEPRTITNTEPLLETRAIFVLPPDVPEVAWNNWLEMRKAIHKKPTPRAMELAVATLRNLAARGHPMDQVLDQSTLNSWQGLFPLKPQNGATNGQQKTAGEQRADRQNAKYDRVCKKLGLVPQGSGNVLPLGNAGRGTEHVDSQPRLLPARGSPAGGR